MVKKKVRSSDGATGKRTDSKTVKRKTLFMPGGILAKKYKIIEEIGSGGMGTVYLAEDIRLDRKAAIKTLSEKIYKDRELRERFIREAKALSKVEHPNICTIYEIFEEKNRLFIAMQYIDGKGLHELPLVKLTLEQKIEIIYQVALGLNHAHNANIIHRDIKPSNIRIDKRGIIKILDFGLAKRLEPERKIEISPSAETIPIDDYEVRSKAAQTRDGIIIGTVYYMSPEQARGEKADKRSDIFSFGTVMYELIAGKLPYPATDTVSALFHIVNTPPLKLAKFAAGVPKRLVKVINKALEKDPEKRYQNMEELIRDIEKVRADVAAEPSSKIMEELKKIVAFETPDRTDRTKDKSQEPSPYDITTIKHGFSRLRVKIVVSALIAIASMVALALITGYYKQFIDFFTKEKKLPPSIVVISKFNSAELPQETGEAVQFLLIRSLSQLPGIWFIDDEKFQQLKEKHRILKLDKAGYAALHSQEGLSALVTGTLDKFGPRGMIEIAPRIIKIERQGKNIRTRNLRLDITPVEGQKDILLRLVDEISTEIINKMGFKGAGEVNGIASITTDNWNALLLYIQAERAWAVRKTEETLDLLKRALKIDKDFALAYGLFGELQKFKGNNNTALEYLKTALSKPDRLTYTDRLYFESLKAELELDYLKQMELLKKLSIYRPLDWNTSFALAEAYFHRGKIQEARTAYEVTLKLSPKFAQALNHLGYCLSYLGEHTAAIEILKRYKSLDETYNAYDSLGDGYYYAGDYERAELYKIAALQKNPAVDWIYRSLADIYMTVGRTTNALEMNDQFNRIAAGDKRRQAQAALQRAFIYIINNRRIEAKALIEKARSLYDTQEIFSFLDDMHWLAGIWNIEGGQIEKAGEELKWLKTIVDKYNVEPDKYFTFYKYYLHLKALYEYNEGRTADARETMKSLVNLGPKLGYWITFHHLAYFRVESARLEYEMKNYEVAEVQLNEAMKAVPNYPLALYYLAKLYDAKGEREKACEYFRSFLDVCKGSDEAYPPIYEAKKYLKLI